MRIEYLVNTLDLLLVILTKLFSPKQNLPRSTVSRFGIRIFVFGSFKLGVTTKGQFGFTTKYCIGFTTKLYAWTCRNQ